MSEDFRKWADREDRWEFMSKEDRRAIEIWEGFFREAQNRPPPPWWLVAVALGFAALALWMEFGR